MMKKRLFIENLKSIKYQYKDNKIKYAIYIILRMLVLLTLILNIIEFNLQSAMLCLLVLLLFIIPVIIEKNFKINLPTVLEIIILLFIFSSFVLGEINKFYLKIPFWDKMLHTLNGFLCAAVGFSLVDILNKNEKIKFELSPFFLAVTAFCFSMTIGVFWEFFEYVMDRLFGLDMQKDVIINSIESVTITPNGTVGTIDGITSVIINGQELGLNGYLDIGLIDTMEDLLVNFLGALVFSIIGYFYIKGEGKKGFASNFIPTKERGEKDETN